MKTKNSPAQSQPVGRVDRELSTRVMPANQTPRPAGYIITL